MSRGKKGAKHESLVNQKSTARPNTVIPPCRSRVNKKKEGAIIDIITTSKKHRERSDVCDDGEIGTSQMAVFDGGMAGENGGKGR